MTTRPIPIRLEKDLVDRLKLVTDVLSMRASGVPLTRSAVMRRIIEIGLVAVEEEMKHPHGAALVGKALGPSCWVKGVVAQKVKVKKEKNHVGNQ